MHGLNVSVGLDLQKIGKLQYFRVYWLCLNVSYVMEFFLQTLVKKRYMGQKQMLALQVYKYFHITSLLYNMLYLTYVNLPINMLIGVQLYL